MQDSKLLIEANEPCPQVEFDFAEHRYAISGTCYPENTREFFEPILSRFEETLTAASDVSVAFELKLAYFNSGASRIFMQFFDILETCAAGGNNVTVKWICEEGDENMIELAEDFEEDFEAASYEVIVEAFD